MAANAPPAPIETPGTILVLGLTLATMLAATNQFALSALLPVVSDDLSVSVPILGQVTTLVFLGAGVIGLFAGPIADKYGKRRVLIVGFVIILLSCAGTAVAPTYGWLLVSRLGAALSGGLMAGTALAIAGTLFSGAGRRKAIGAVIAGNAVTGIVTVPGMALIASVTSWRMSYVVLGTVALAMVPLMYRVLPDDRIADAGRLDLQAVLDAYRPLIAQRSMVILYSANVVRAIGWGGTVNYFAAFLGKEKGISTGWIGAIFMITAAGYLLGNRLASSRVAEGDPRKVCGIATAVMAVLFALGIVLPVGTMAPVALMTAGAMAGGLGFVMLVTLISTETHAGQATTMSLNAALFSFGTALGTLLGGVFLAVGGYTLLGLGLMIFSILAAALVWRPIGVVTEVIESPGATP